MAVPSTRDEPLLDYAAEIAKASNHLIYIDGTTLKVVDRIQISDPVTTFRSPTLLSLSISPAFPIKQVFAEFEFNVPYPDTVTLAQETKRVIVPNLTFGEEQQYESLSTVEEESLLFLRNIRTSESAPLADVFVDGIQDEIEFGDRIKAIDERLAISAIITITGIIYDFDNETTTFKGPSEIDFVVSE